MGALRFDGTNDTVTLPAQYTMLWGNTNVVVEFCVALTTYPASGNKYFTGVLTGSSNEGLCLRQASGDGALALVIGGVNQTDFTSGAGYILNDGALHTYRIERDAGVEIRFYRDGTLFQTKPWVTSSNFTLRIQRFGMGSTVTSGALGHDLEYFKIVTGGSPSNEEWNANLSGGTGTTLPSVSGTNQGTLVSFDTAVCWVNFSTAVEFASNAASTSLSESSLSTAINFASMSYSTSASTSNIVAGAINFASMSYSTSLAFSDMATQIAFLSSSRSTSRSSSDLVNDTPTFNSLAYSSSASYSDLSTSILFNSVANSVSSSYSNLTEESVARYLERWDGLNFNAHTLERWNGTQYLRHPLERWDGEQWVRYNG